MSTAHGEGEDFESFYRRTRTDVLLGSFLLTGDLTAATSATKDAYARAWQRWKKLTLRRTIGVDPLDDVRSTAWRLAVRRSTGRIWHRNKGLSEDQRAVLDAFHQLSAVERRALVLVDVHRVAPPAAARQLALTREVAAARLESAREAAIASLGPAYAERLVSLSPVAEASRLPRASVLVRAGRKRQRAGAIGGVAAAVGLTLGLGALAYEAPVEADPGVQPPTVAPLPEGVSATTPEQLVDAARLGRAAPGHAWTELRTNTNTRGNGLNITCQQTRFADPAGVGGLIRVFGSEGDDPARALQTVEISADDASARKAFTTAVGWFGRCTEPRIHLVGTYELPGIGDAAALMRLRVPGSPARGFDVALAREGAITTLLATETTNRPPQPRELAALLSDAVADLCPESEDCATGRGVRVVPTTPPPSGEDRGFLATIDLPPLTGVNRPWAGIEAINALREPDTPTRCAQVDFSRTAATNARARTFLVPQAQLPSTFGLTQTYAVFPTAKAAGAFLTRIRDGIDTCDDDDLTTEVSEDARSTTPQRDLSIWRIDATIEENRTVTFRVGFVRVGRVVSKVTFVSAPQTDLAPEVFSSLVRRAAERLGELPAVRR